VINTADAPTFEAVPETPRKQLRMYLLAVIAPFGSIALLASPLILDAVRNIPGW